MQLFTRAAAPSSRTRNPRLRGPPPQQVTMNRCGEAVYLYLTLTLWPTSVPPRPPICSSTPPTRSLPILGHFTYLYPFLSLLAGRFGMARLPPFRVVPRRRVWDISTRSGTSHLRGRPWRWHGDAWWEMCGGALSAPLSFPARHRLLQPPPTPPPLQGPRLLQKHTVLQLLRAFPPQRSPRPDAVARRWREDRKKCSRALRTRSCRPLKIPRPERRRSARRLSPLPRNWGLSWTRRQESTQGEVDRDRNRQERGRQGEEGV